LCVGPKAPRQLATVVKRAGTAGRDGLPSAGDQDDRLTDRLPCDAIGRMEHRAGRCSADREVEMMVAQRLGEPGCVPELRVARI
jgi:hypothetical protein